jgi:hypothetical protein
MSWHETRCPDCSLLRIIYAQLEQRMPYGHVLSVCLSHLSADHSAVCQWPYEVFDITSIRCVILLHYVMKEDNKNTQPDGQPTPQQCKDH